MAGERLPDFGETGAPAPVVDPSVGTDPSSAGQSAAPQQDASAQNAGASAASAGPPAGEGTQPAPASPPAEPPATPASQPPPETPSEGQQPSEAEAQPPPGEGEPDLTEEEYTQFKARLQEELAAPYAERLRTQQSGQDKAMSAVQQQLEASNARLDQITQEVREGKLQGLTPEEQAGLRKTWELDDREKKLNKYEETVKSFHSDTDILALLNEYEQFGVTEEVLTAVPIDERELFCEQKRAEYWEAKAKAGGQSGTNGQPQQPAPPPKPVPAGVHAPSDTGGGGSAEPPPQPNTEQGPGAMADNIGRRESWQTPTFDVTRRG